MIEHLLIDVVNSCNVPRVWPLCSNASVCLLQSAGIRHCSTHLTHFARLHCFRDVISIMSTVNVCSCCTSCMLTEQLGVDIAGRPNTLACLLRMAGIGSMACICIGAGINTVTNPELI